MIVMLTAVNESELSAHIADMDKATKEWTLQAARGECGWVCSDCCGSAPEGMPNACFYGDKRCTEIIQRDKREAMAAGNEPF